MLEYVARLNVVVAAFNLIPALPLDGGRILRAWLWHRQRDRLAATRSGARAGQAFGVTLMVVGLLDLWAGAGLLGLWLLLLGGFLLRAASAELADARTRHHLDGLTAADVMASDPGVVLNDTPVSRLVEHPPAPERTGYPVLGGGRLLGVVVLAHARQVPPEEAPQLRVEEVMTPLDDVPMVDAADPVVDVVGRLNGTNPTGQVVVVADGMVVGILDEGDVADALDRAPHGGGGRAPGARAWAMVAGLCLVSGAALYRPPFVIVSTGATADVTRDVSVVGFPVTAVNGRYVVPEVAYQRTNGLATLVAAVRDRRRVVAVSRVRDEATVPGVTREVRILAAAAAAQSQGLPATVTGTGARVVAVRSGSPAAGVLRRRRRDPGRRRPARHAKPPSWATSSGRGPSAPPSPCRSSATARRTSSPSPSPPTGWGSRWRPATWRWSFPSRSASRVGPPADRTRGWPTLWPSPTSSRPPMWPRAAPSPPPAPLTPTATSPPPHDLAATASAEAGADVVVLPPGQADGARRDGLQVVGVESLARALEALSTTV